MGVDNTQYNLLYSLYSWPNVILSLIGGVLIDRFIGVRIGTVVFSLLVTAGQVSLLFFIVKSLSLSLSLSSFLSPYPLSIISYYLLLVEYFIPFLLCLLVDLYLGTYMTLNCTCTCTPINSGWGERT